MCQQILVKISSMKFQENLSSGSHAVSCKQTGMTRLVVAVHFANAPESALEASLAGSDTTKHMHH